MRVAAIGLLACAVALASTACNLGGGSKSDSAPSVAAAHATSTAGATSASTGGSTGSSATGSTGSTATGGSMTATVAWTAASGPVTGYRVAVSRNGGAYQAESDVSGTSTTLYADPGDTLRVRVAALDADGNRGPYSDPSDPIVFATDGSVFARHTSSTTTATTTSATSSTSSGSSTDAAAVANVMLENKTRFDFDGDRASDLLWESPAPDLGLRITRFAGDALVPSLDFDRPNDDWSVVTADDFDGDGRADIVWENSDGVLVLSAASRLYETAPTTPLALLGLLGAQEQVVATGDFDADGRADLLVRDEATSTHSLWLTDASGTSQRAALAVPVASGGLALRTGDFDGDGHSDIVWRGPDGAISVSFMDGAVATEILPIAGSTGHEILASGDFDGDGADDLVHSDPATQAVGVLLMSARKQPVAWATSVDPGVGWGLAAAGDYDGDGRADLLWESEAGLVLGLHPAGSVGASFVPIDAGGSWIVIADQ